MDKTISNLLGITLGLTLTACAGPDEKTYEGGWSVVRNQCDDMSSRIRNKKETRRYTRELVLYGEEQRKILELNILATSSGANSVLKSYKNNSSNSLSNTEDIPYFSNLKKIKGKINAAVDSYYNQPGKGEAMDRGCLYRGINHD